MADGKPHREVGMAGRWQVQPPAHARRQGHGSKSAAHLYSVRDRPFLSRQFSAHTFLGSGVPSPNATLPGYLALAIRHWAAVPVPGHLPGPEAIEPQAFLAPVGSEKTRPRQYIQRSMGV